MKEYVVGVNPSSSVVELFEVEQGVETMDLVDVRRFMDLKEAEKYRSDLMQEQDEVQSEQKRTLPSDFLRKK